MVADTINWFLFVFGNIVVGSSGSCKFEFAAAVLFSSLDSEKDRLILNGNFWFFVAAVTPLVI